MKYKYNFLNRRRKKKKIAPHIDPFKRDEDLPKQVPQINLNKTKIGRNTHIELLHGRRIYSNS